MTLLDALRALPDVEEAPSQFHGERAFWVDGREFLHFVGDDAVEIRLTRKQIAGLGEPRAPQRTRTSDWVVVDASEHALVLDLARRALDANRR